MGWSNRAAVCLAVEKTGNIITAAGLIMSISFAGNNRYLSIYLSSYLFVCPPISLSVCLSFYLSRHSTPIAINRFVTAD